MTSVQKFEQGNISPDRSLTIALVVTTDSKAPCMPKNKVAKAAEIQIFSSAKLVKAFFLT